MGDNEIIELFWQRSEDAVNNLKRKYGALCRTVIFGILYSPEDAEECENEVYFKVWSSIPPKRPLDLAAYICQIARRLALDKYRYYHRQKRNITEIELAAAELSGCIPSNDHIDEYLDNITVENTLNDFLKTLSKRDRIIFLRRYWFFDSIKEISALTGINENTLKVILHRARKTLYKVLIKEGVAIEEL
ncbi:RNA polymerase sigma-70 factor, ECF subfamily [Sporobacter termitidis DSM 10068]|uniref:RNA polymerase sigma-70 factor, ECF subfamily n=1 Tax=Sporobacter termitidis DSM 10068 TaxID=1123282 RepID=A0A1M5YGK5_9FIRM|nr:RNA polymerase sigma factor [Sporobacter termitidis]SHI11024.1 RNA polymerase sigma-70 factor, ECF subfamily [Sporobacter termitidis DSM 10068]